MTRFLVNRKARVAAEVYEHLRDHLGAVPASQWMRLANAALGGRTPIQAIREGRFEEAMAAARQRTNGREEGA